MSGPVTLDKEGRRKVTMTSVEKLELQHLTMRDFMAQILTELRKMNLHLEIMTEERILDSDVEGEMR